MLSVRIIPRLELCGTSTIESAGELQQAGADEVWFWGFGGSDDRATLTTLRDELCVPITVACAPRMSEIDEVFATGADRVLVPAHELELIERITRQHGEGSCSAALRTEENAENEVRYRVDAGRASEGRDPLPWAQRAIESGATEIVLSQVDRDGRRRAPDTDVTALLSAAIDVAFSTPASRLGETRLGLQFS